MKKVIVLIALLLVFSMGSFAEEIQSIIPDASIWGISPDTLKASYEADFEECQVGEDTALRVSNVEVNSYDMEAYYVFGEKMNTSEGTAYNGLSKIAYILNVSEFDDDTDFDECYTTLVEEIKKIEGEPNTEKNNTVLWKTDQYKIELGKGKLSKYTGLDNETVGIIFKKVDLSKPSKTPNPTKKPKVTKTPKPTKGATIGEANALASALRYLDFTSFSRKGLIGQLEFEGYSKSEAEYAVNNCGANWNEQAAKKAKEYLEYTSFSKKGLIEQLEYEGFTHDQAVYGVKAVGY